MDIIYVLVPIAMLFVLVAVLVFLWAVKSEQFEDLNRQGMQILFEEDEQPSAARPAANKPDSKTQTKNPDQGPLA
ncbi:MULTISPECIES: cbb3-type cytochrome oxidase assembly protein CcoS [Plesiomonas]|uniref:Cbb3-type cytochrome oxidase maturation protein n=1 Tax=Plesiomonas shigelloides 302-73 TaxID=1315976 RepID=R8APT2_PLESH|nr:MULTISPECIES: cbb3-type cytochrome oxidase assembly protein CcoS [Plesiomonas]EON88332.1 cbb3-type cytochrome oxidase maturation protein [Plesiomonas shigelloides 302-73]KAB7674990.1 cbb3-type cytochrome oxidase assembly protein CcoS [Plesiomonas shigelloides]KAB7686969.1 cbb3-type cytochrome oxidase assembly protein CcoS [Plesiomonas shigelloides]KAB7703467.1 cbb3-type cytochrome oxidase assembly protein CcoS [Plesiomonas shigelloides]MCE5163445.1 cbb3-type cytochrome oxidase assembly prot